MAPMLHKLAKAEDAVGNRQEAVAIQHETIRLLQAAPSDEHHQSYNLVVFLLQLVHFEVQCDLREGAKGHLDEAFDIALRLGGPHSPTVQTLQRNYRAFGFELPSM